MKQHQALPFCMTPKSIARASLVVGALLGFALPARAYDAIRPMSPLGAYLANLAQQTGQPLAPMLDAAHPWVPPVPDSATIERNRAARMMRATEQPLAAQTSASVDFAVPRGINAQQTVSDIATGDFNGDGRSDAAMIEQPGGLAVLLGTHDGLAPAITYPLPATATGVTCGDFDGDGKQDLAVAFHDSPGLATMHGNGDGTFAAAQPLAFPLGFWAIGSGDLNGDGRTDLVAVEGSDSSLVVLLNAGGGTFPTVTRYTLPGNGNYCCDYLVGIALGDFNGDGRLDVATSRVIVSNFTNPPRALSVQLNQGGGALGPRQDYTLTVNPWSMCAGDLDNDGRDDLVLGSYIAQRINVLHAGAGGVFSAPAVVQLVSPDSPFYRTGARLADMDGDGHLDLIATYNDGDCYLDRCALTALLRGVGDGTFEPAISWHASDPDGVGQVGALAVADFTGDHVPDLVVARASQNWPTTSVLPGVRSPRWVAPARRPTPSGVYELRAGRLRPGAMADLVASDRSAVYVMRNRGNGTFADPDSFATGALATLEDFNRDGLQDVVIAMNETTLVRLANGTGGFGPPTTLVSGPFLATGDFTGDGHSDLAVKLANGNVGILAGDGAGHFGPASDFGRPLGAGAAAPQGADVDRDGRCDLVFARSGADSDSVVVMWSTGSAFATDTRAGIGPRRIGQGSYYHYVYLSDIQTGDFDGDGLLDIVVVRRSAADEGGVIDVVTSASGRSLSKGVEYGAGVEPLMATVADFDGDGLADIAVSNIRSSYTGRFSAFHSLGGAGFEGVSYAVEHYATTIAAGDFDGDGRVDVAVGCLSAHSIVAVPNISPISAPTAVVASLVSASAAPGRVSLVWELGQLSVASATIERSVASTSGWSVLASVNADAAGRVAYEDRDVAAGARYGYRLRIASGNSTATSVETWVDVPKALALAIAGAHPNPTRGPLTVSFTLPTSDRARLELLDVTGRRVRERTFDAPSAGAHQVALEEQGPLAPGLYFLRLSQSSRIAEARVAIVR